MELVNRSESMTHQHNADETDTSLENVVEMESVAVDTSQIWRNKLVTMAYVASSTIIAYALIVGFVLLES